MPEIDIDFQTYLPTINTFKNYYDILRSRDNSTDVSMNTLKSQLKSRNLQITS